LVGEHLAALATTDLLRNAQFRQVQERGSDGRFGEVQCAGGRLNGGHGFAFQVVVDPQGGAGRFADGLDTLPVGLEELQDARGRCCGLVAGFLDASEKERTASLRMYVYRKRDGSGSIMDKPSSRPRDRLASS